MLGLTQVNVDSKHRRITKFKNIGFFLIFLFHVLMTFERDGRVCGGHMSTPKKAEVQQKNHRRMDHTEQKGSQKGRMWDVTVLKGALKML